MKKARDIMTANPQCVTPEDTVTRAAEIMRDSDVGVVPVVEDQGTMRLAGVVTDRDIAVRVVAEGRNSNEIYTREVMSSGLTTVKPDDDVSRVMDLMKREQVRRIPVVEGERLVGIIAQADIATDVGSDRKTGDVVEKISEPHHR
jgi:CBS domain-containing protein